MKSITLIVLSLLMVAPKAQSKPFQSKEMYVCYPSELLQAVDNDCTLTPVLEAMNTIDPSATREVLEAALMLLGQRVTNYVIGCEVTKIKVDLENQENSTRAIYTDTTTEALKETVVSKNSSSISMDITLTGFASGLPMDKTLVIENQANAQNMYKATVKDQKTSDDFLCYSHDVSE